MNSNLEKHIKNLVEYIEEDSVYQSYKKNKSNKLDAVDVEDVKHCIDIEQVIKVVKEQELDTKKQGQQDRLIKRLQEQINCMNAKIEVRDEQIAIMQREWEEKTKPSKSLEARLNILEARNIMLLDVYNSLDEGEVKDSIGTILGIGEKDE